MKKEIVFLMSSLGMGGAERVVVSLANWLVTNTDSNVTILKFIDEKSSYPLNDKIRIIDMPKSNKNRFLNIVDRYNFCKKEFSNIEPDIIISFFNKTQLYAYLSKPKKTVLIGSERCNVLELSFYEKLFSKAIAKKCDGFIFQTERVKKYYPKKVRKNSAVIYNAISNQKAIDASKKNYLKENIITAMGRLNPQKGFDILIKSFKKVVSEFPNYKLLIYGEGEEREKLQSLINSLSLENNVKLCGNDKDAIYTVAKSKIFVLSSRFEGMPNALIEAMATGTACISTDCDFGPRELIENNHNGILVPIDDEKVLAEKIIYLLKNDITREDLGNNAKSILTKLDSETIYKKYYDYLSKVLSEKNYKINTKKLSYKIFMFLKHRNYTDILSDKLYLKIIFKLRLGYSLDLKNPQTFNEKLQWLKLYDRNPKYIQMVDKYEVRKYISENIGEEYLIPLIGVYNRFEEINFEELPNQFVIKCTHDSGGVVICKNKSKFDIRKAKEKIKKSMKRNFYYSGREWPYKNIKPKIIIEQYMEDKKAKELIDFKIMCFNGIPKFSFTCSERYNDGLKVTFYNLSWEKMSFERHYPSSTKNIEKPKNYELMLELSKKLSKNIPFVRVDWYEINGKLYFGELTFYPGSGLEEFKPFSWDKKLGNLLSLEKIGWYNE